MTIVTSPSRFFSAPKALHHVTTLDDQNMVLSEENLTINKAVLNQLTDIVQPRNYFTGSLSSALIEGHEGFGL
jgi:hypothetical protein